MCFFKMPEMPKPEPLPRVPQPDADVIAQRSDSARALAAKGGTAGNINTDLNPSEVTGARPVLKPANAVYLGQ
jgi:hypothetical protein